MTTKTNNKAKLSLNKRTIVLLNEHTMHVLNGGTGTTNDGTFRDDGGPASGKLNDAVCNVTKEVSVCKSYCDIKCGKTGGTTII
jgi:hypothetical protein